jgi:salicylate hydroxylase
MLPDAEPGAIVALSRYPDIEVTIYEAASKLAEVGAGVGVFPRTAPRPLC